jgi:uncharacterized protein (DUF433 family)
MATEVVSEAEKMRRVPGIFFVTDVGERQPWIKGTGLEVVEIIQVYKDVDWELDHLRASFEWLSEEQIQAALDYYAAFPDEVNAKLIDDVEALVRKLWEECPETRPPWAR